MTSGDVRHVYAFPRVVPLASILEHYHVLSELRKIGNQLFGTCPIHHGTNKKQFVVDLDKNVWRCFGDCDRGGGTLELVAELERIEIKEAGKLVRELFALAPRSQVEKHRKPKERAMSGERPSHKVFVVEGEGENAFWHRAGSAWPHKDGKGLNMQIPTGMSLSGRVVLREYNEEDAKEDEAKKAKFAKKK
jgi:hypothetical protein